MRINKCDICEKETQINEAIDIRTGYHHHELCKDCAKPVLAFLRKSKLIKKDAEK